MYFSKSSFILKYQQFCFDGEYGNAQMRLYERIGVDFGFHWAIPDFFEIETIFFRPYSKLDMSPEQQIQWAKKKKRKISEIETAY